MGSELGNSPWSVLAEGVSVHAPLSIGAATVAISFVVLALWIPLRQWPGLGTVLNAVLVGVALDVTEGLLPDDQPLVVRAAEVPTAIVLVALGSGVYINAGLGPGPRDGLMTGLHRATNRPVSAIRAALEISVLTAGALLGGTFGPERSSSPSSSAPPLPCPCAFYRCDPATPAARVTRSVRDASSLGRHENPKHASASRPIGLGS